MFGGTIEVPLVLRTKVAMGTGYGSQHSMDPAGIFATSPPAGGSWRPRRRSTTSGYSTPRSRCKDPVLVLEHVDLYISTGMAPVEDSTTRFHSARPRFAVPAAS